METHSLPRRNREHSEAGTKGEVVRLTGGAGGRAESASDGDVVAGVDGSVGVHIIAAVGRIESLAYAIADRHVVGGSDDGG